MPDLPSEPSLTQLRRQARDLQRAVRSGVPEALAEVAERHPAGRPDDTAAVSFALSAAQLVVARRYGFPSWARLRRYVEVLERYSRFPARMAQDTPTDPAAPAEDFLRLACLRYEDDQPERWAQALRILEEHPEITQVSIHAAAAAADVPRLAASLAADPRAANRPGGPYRWEPLFYLAYARHDPAIEHAAVLRAARLLLQAGADPNAGYLWHGLPTPFTVLTGIFGEGELGPVRQPRHPHAQTLARLLLEAGADPNDGQALYNRMFEPGNDHLELLLEFGLGAGDGGPWKERMGDALDTPEQLVRGDSAGRLRMARPSGSGSSSPRGHRARPAARSEVRRRGSGRRSRHYRRAAGRPSRPGEAVRRRRPSLTVWAAAQGQPGSVELLAGLGFDVNAKGRSDAPAKDPWETALHVAAMEGNLGLAQSLLSLGADPDIRDERFNSTPLGWAWHFGQEQLIELLEPFTTPEDETDG